MQRQHSASVGYHYPTLLEHVFIYVSHSNSQLVESQPSSNVDNATSNLLHPCCAISRPRPDIHSFPLSPCSSSANKSTSSELSAQSPDAWLAKGRNIGKKACYQHSPACLDTQPPISAQRKMSSGHRHQKATRFRKRPRLRYQGLLATTSG